MLAMGHGFGRLRLNLAVLLFCASLSISAHAESVKGVFALPDVDQAVTGEMTLKETGPLSRTLEVVMADMSSGQQIDTFEMELTQELHILAVDDQLTTLVHRHVEHATADGKFVSEFEFPHPGLYHIYTDAVPENFGQQVLRFDVVIGDPVTPLTAADRTARLKDALSEHPSSSSGRYVVKLDPSKLQAGEESMISLAVSKDGQTAEDIEPYLGVAAHAVFVRADDLTYVHAHAMTDVAEPSAHGAEPVAHGTGGDDHDAEPAMEGMHHDMTAEQASTDASNHHDHSSAEPGDNDQRRSGTQFVAPDMTVHVTPPDEGTYALWIEFMGGGDVQTVPFALEVPPAHHHH